MKRLTFSLILSLLFAYCQGQDIINLKDKTKLDVKVIEKTDRIVKYMFADYDDSPVISVKTNRISSIEYQNGFVDPAGNQNPRRNKPLGFSGGVALDLNGDYGLLTASANYFIIPQVDLELGIGTDTEEGYCLMTGARIHLNSDYSENRVTPFIGVLGGTIMNELLIQFPVGLSYLSKQGLNASLSLNHMIVRNSWESTFFELRIGWRFK